MTDHQLSLAKLRKLIGPTIGVFDREATRRTPLGFYRTTVLKGNEYLGYGYSRDLERSKVVAIAESIERFSLERVPVNAVIFNDYRECSLRKISHFEWAPIPDFLKKDLSYKINPEFTQQYIVAGEYFSGAEFAIPLDRILLRRSFFYHTTTNGAAGHFDVVKARERALCEILERDALLTHWWTKNSFIKIPNSEMKFLGNLENDLERLNAQIEFGVPRMDHTIPIVFARISAIDPKNSSIETRFSMGGGCDRTIQAAGFRAMIEALMLLETSKVGDLKNFSFNFNRSVVDFSEPLYIYRKSNWWQKTDFLFSESGSINELNFSNIETEADYFAELKKMGCRLFMIPQSSLESETIGFHVVRALSPDLLDLIANHGHRPISHPRLVELPRKMNWKLQPQSAIDMNLLPQPFA